MSATNSVDIGAGTILMWAGTKNNVPAGWHVCDGTLLSQTQYAALYKVIGLNFGASPPSGQFYLPDLRGQFIRGVDDGTGADPDTADRYDMQDPTKAYAGVGSVQACALQSHTHSYNQVTSSSSGSIDNAHAYTTSSTATGAPDGATTSDNETRPVNAYLYFIIKT